jgi:mevalonate kinase
MIKASAPGKVILFGEHAVVYGEPSLAGAINKRVFVGMKKSKGKITMASGGKKESFSLNDISSPSKFPYVKKAIELTFEKLEKQTGLEIKISSEIPPASGLGSSASVSVATVLALSHILNEPMEKNEIARLGYKTELEVQGAASRTDSAVVTYGGLLFIHQSTYEKIDAEIPLIIGWTREERSTKELVRKVGRLKKEFPEVIDPIIKSIGSITKQAKKRILEGSPIGDLMNINHGLLEALGVSTDKLNRAVYAARKSGAEGAKLTGAGGGGCMIAYAPKNRDVVKRVLEEEDCTVLDVAISKNGVRIEA